MTPVSNTSGGAAAGGGFGFHAALGAIADVHILRGTPIDWTDGLTAVPPVAASFETGGPGDDIALELSDRTLVEVQAKRRLSANGRFWSALQALCAGVAADHCKYGILVVCPHSSLTVRDRYAQALRRIGDGRLDNPSPEQARLAAWLHEKGHRATEVCRRIRIKTVAALADDGGAVTTARAELAHVCGNKQAIAAWHALWQDALVAIGTRGRRCLRDLYTVLAASGVEVVQRSGSSPVATVGELIRATLSATADFQALGIERPLSMEKAWLPLAASIRENPSEPAASAEEALAAYHANDDASRRAGVVVDAETIGTFSRRCVIVGGPGSGKSLLLQRLAREFAKDGHVILRVSLRLLAARIEHTGCTIEEGLLELGLDTTRVSPAQLADAHVEDLVVLCDGLDESGDHQLEIARGLRDFAASHPAYRVIVTTRPIGYVSTAELEAWRQYVLSPFDDSLTAQHLETLCRAALPDGDDHTGDKLRSRIRAYVSRGDPSRILGRSPLLLAFGAALFLKHNAPSRTKADLYDRVFALIDSARAPRKAVPGTPAPAIRDSVIDRLGWLTTLAPLQPARRLLAQCAGAIRSELDTTDVQALANVQSTVAYFEQAGLIERLRHGGIDFLAFIHKTCGEFAAARHLSRMAPERAREALRQGLGSSAWHEILDFTVNTSLATTLAELLVEAFDTSEPDQATLDRALRVLARPEVSLPPEQRRALLAQAFALARSDDRRKANRAGITLTSNDLSGLPETRAMAQALLSAPLEWTKLVGWAVLATHFPEILDRGRLEEAVEHFTERSSDREFLIRLDTRLPLGPHYDRALLETFLIAALRHLLSDQELGYQDELIARVLAKQPDMTVGFVERMRRLLGEIERADACSLLPHDPVPQPLLSQEYVAAETALHAEVLAPAFVRDDSGAPFSTGYKCLAGVYAGAGIGDASFRDIWKWPSDRNDLPDLHAVLRAAAYVFNIPEARLAAEAKDMLEKTTSARRASGRSYIYDMLPRVDPGQADWSRAREYEVDTDLLERLVHHPSEWVSLLATRLLDACLETDRAAVCDRILQAGTANALRLWGALALELPEPRGREIILRRLRGKPVPGLHHLFELLARTRWQPVPSELPVLESGLLQCDAKTAVAAADCCHAAATGNDRWLAPLLRSSMRHWMETEKPYPRDRGVVPDSPRAALLQLLCDVAPPPFDQLVDLVSDLRPDVSEAAIDGLRTSVARSSKRRSKLVDLIGSKHFGPNHASKLLTKEFPYTESDLRKVTAFAHDADPVYRTIAVDRVFSHPAMDPTEAVSAVLKMKDDGNGRVRDVANEFLDSMHDANDESPVDTLPVLADEVSAAPTGE